MGKWEDEWEEDKKEEKYDKEVDREEPLPEHPVGGPAATRAPAESGLTPTIGLIIGGAIIIAVWWLIRRR